MSLGGFFGGGKGITWPDQPPKSITGTITVVHPPEPVNDPKTGLPTDRKQVRIELETTERDSDQQFDDGARTLYVKSYMRSAIGDALRRAGAKEPEVGGTLTVTFVRTEPADRPGLSPSKHFEAVYTPPSKGVAEHFGTAAAAAPAAPAVPTPTAAAPVKPAAISDAAWASMDDATRATVSATMAAATAPF